MPVFRCYVEKKQGFADRARALREDIRRTLGAGGLKDLRLFQRYDIEGITQEAYDAACHTVFSEPPCDVIYHETLPPLPEGARVFAVEALPGQYDQRADSLEQCIQMVTRGARPTARAATVYVLTGDISEAEYSAIQNDIINPVESRLAGPEKPQSLIYRAEDPAPVEILDSLPALEGEALSRFIAARGLAMDTDDLTLFRDHFRREGRAPTLTELKVVDTYWSDHCRHTTFLTRLDQIVIEDPRIQAAFDRYLAARKEVYGETSRPVTLMDMGTLAAKLLKKRGFLKNLDDSEEINACSIKIDAAVDGRREPWLLMFKNETHNHPTEIEPFGGAATCLGGAIRDPLSGRSYVYQAMRVTGAGDPRTPYSETLSGKLPQSKLTVTAAEGYSSYGNQIGLATGLVHEFYHEGYRAKRLEIGAVVGAAPAENVRRLRPEPGDTVLLIGGRTGRDGCGGATGSSKTHTAQSVSECASEVQKGNAPEERKLQRLFRNPEAAGKIKRCNDFGAGGVCVAIGELCPGIEINLDAVPKKYAGLDGTELAISESQERMAVVCAPEDEAALIRLAEAENLEATRVAVVTETPRLRMVWRGDVICDLDRAFLDTNGAPKHMSAQVEPAPEMKAEAPANPLPPSERLLALAEDLAVCSQRGLVERFDASIGAASVMTPFGGKTERSPAQVMAALLPVPAGETTTASVMAFGFDPYLSEKSPYDGAKAAVTESVAKLCAAGCDYKNAYLTFQEYFERLGDDPLRWGKPVSALLGAFDAQTDLGVAAIGGKDSMSGSFMEMDVPPTLVSFAIAPEEAENLRPTAFAGPDHPVYLFAPEGGGGDALRACFEAVLGQHRRGNVLSAWAVGSGGIAEGLMKMAFGNRVGFTPGSGAKADLFASAPGAILLELKEDTDAGTYLGRTTAAAVIDLGDSKEIDLDTLLARWEAPLEAVFPTAVAQAGPAQEAPSREGFAPRHSPRISRPKAIIPVFPGTNCEYDTARAVERAGGEAEILVLRNLKPEWLLQSAEALEKALSQAQMLILPGGFSGGDEPDGSAKFIVSFFKNPRITEAVHRLLERQDGLILGICNGFQALIKLGLLPDGRISDRDACSPTLAHNRIGRHQARYVRTKVRSAASPWLHRTAPGEIYTVPVSHGEGRFTAPEAVLNGLFDQGLIATQYVDEAGAPSMDIRFNPNGSAGAVEGIISPDGRIYGRMAHHERTGQFVAIDIPGQKAMPVFEGGVCYFAD
ncbi:phosphoribosylformylglycinamidine synthase [Oscillospiraceae bacterium OttesenSCG-928-F05]|nr:phosphoribosylformylglycinamidine synthase [Oscillospiraceae bacterium OttesenSCG-928-F05]